MSDRGIGMDEWLYKHVRAWQQTGILQYTLTHGIHTFIKPKLLIC